MAAKIAKKSTFQRHRLGAVIVKGGRVLSTGFNQHRPSAKLGTPTLHAEAAAILKLLNQRRLHDLTGADLYVTRFTAGGAVGISKPCRACTELIRSAGIRNVYYTTDADTTIKMKV